MGFNRYMVECECILKISRIIIICVLIDTWWNVNQEKQAIITMMEQRFNRYMVECEFICCQIKRTAEISFNRYMVECESVWLRFRDIIGRCFNRYMVECELDC